MTRFEIAAPDEVLEDLRDRLSRTRWPDQLENIGWDDGTDVGYLRELCEYWQSSYDWRAQERLLNSFEQFIEPVGELQVHFMHVRSPEPDALPLVITHGWPGSVFEFHKVIGPLTDPVAHGGRAEDAFHVVCPSMPGYGYSSPPRERGFDVRAVAETVAALMAQLGYDRFGAQGGDWGGIVTAWLGLVDPEHLAGIHLNMMPIGPPPDFSGEISDQEALDLAEAGEFLNAETGYQRIQGTKPQSLGYGLNDSPAGLAAWIVEKFRTWSDCDGDVESRFTKDELLTNVMLYWLPGAITSSTRLYKESMLKGRFRMIPERADVPTAAAIFPKEMYRPPRAWAEAWFDLRRWTRMPAGGHFAALEEPDALVADIRAFFADLR